MVWNVLVAQQSEKLGAREFEAAIKTNCPSVQAAMIQRILDGKVDRCHRSILAFCQDNKGVPHINDFCPPLKYCCSPEIFEKNKRKSNRNNGQLFKNNGVLPFAPLKFFSSRTPALKRILIKRNHNRFSLKSKFLAVRLQSKFSQNDS